MKKKSAFSYILIAPILGILLVFVAGSLLIAMYFSFTKYNILTPPRFVGLYNYQKLLRDPKFLDALLVTLKMALIIVPVQMVLSTLVGLILYVSRDLFLGKMARVVLFIPYLSSSTICGTVWKAILMGNTPIVSGFFSLLGIDSAMLLGEQTSALITVALLVVWKDLGFYSMISYTAFLSVPGSLREAAKVDGAGSFARFLKIELPLMMPSLFINLFMVTASSVQIFDLVYTMTGGGPINATTNLVLYAYNLTFKSSKAGYGMAVSNALILVTILLVVLQQILLKKEKGEVAL